MADNCSGVCLPIKNNKRIALVVGVVVVVIYLQI